MLALTPQVTREILLERVQFAYQTGWQYSSVISNDLCFNTTGDTRNTFRTCTICHVFFSLQAPYTPIREGSAPPPDSAGDFSSPDPSEITHPGAKSQCRPFQAPIFTHNPRLDGHTPGHISTAVCATMLKPDTDKNAIPCDVAYIPGCPFCYVCNQSLAVFNITRQNASNITWFTISPVKYVSKQHSCN